MNPVKIIEIEILGDHSVKGTMIKELGVDNADKVHDYTWVIVIENKSIEFSDIKYDNTMEWVDGQCNDMQLQKYMIVDKENCLINL